MVKYLGREKERNIQRKENYLKIKCKILEQDLDLNEAERIVGTAGGMNY